MKKLIKKLLREQLDTNEGIVNCYRCIDSEYSNSFDKIEFFAKNMNYAEHFGDNCYEFQIDLTNAKILNLEKWNKLFKDKTNINGNKFNRIQGIFVVGQELIKTGYEEPISRFSKFFPNDITSQFINEFNNCDVIYGEDAGYPNEYVFAVKNKNLIKRVNKLNEKIN